MMKDTFLSHFTPSLMMPAALEAIFVGREELAQELVELVRRSATTKSKHYTLLVGPRGIGKTHLISLLYHRLKNSGDQFLRERLLIAWLSEEEIGVTSFLDLLLRILRAIEQETKDAALGARIEALFGSSPEDAEREARNLLKEYVASSKQTLLLLMENLDELFRGLGEEGQKSLRAFVQETSFVTIVATSPSLFGGVSLQTSPFYGFFRVHHLGELGLGEATRLLTKVAELQGQTELATFIKTPTGRARLRAVDHLARGNPRLYVIFSQFLSRESLESLVEPFMRTLDDLTPYYQSRIAMLSPQQRKIVEVLCDVRHAVTVKEIARRSFLNHQTASAQLKVLRDYNYVHAVGIGRESYYELREPLLRLTVEVKKNRGELVRLLVEFLRRWYSADELATQLQQVPPAAWFEREHLLEALRPVEVEDVGDARVAAFTEKFNSYVETDDYSKALEAAEERVRARGNSDDWTDLAFCHVQLGNNGEALAAAEQALVRNPHNLMAVLQRSLALEGLGRTEEALSDMETVTAILPDNSKLLYNQGVMLVNLNRYGEALECLNRVLQHDPKYQSAWITKGIVLARLSRFEEAAQAFEQCLQLAPQNTVALANYAWALNQQGEWQKALELLNRALELEPAGKAMVWNNHGWALVELGRDEEAVKSFTKALEEDPNNALIWANLGELYRRNDLDAEALAFYTKALECDPDNAFALFGLGTALGRLCRVAESLAYLSKATEVAPEYAPGWANRGAALELLGSFEEAAVSYQRAVELGDRQATTFFNYAQTLSVLNRWSDLYPVLDQALLLTGGVSLEKIDPIIKNLLAGSDNQPNLLERAARLMEVFGKHERDYPLSLGIMRSVPLLVSDQISDKGAEVWVRTWREVAAGSGDFEMALRLIDAALAYRKSKDQRALLELPTEERSLLESLLNSVAGPCLRGKAIV